MIFHENRLLADDSHVISYLIFVENWEKMSQNLSSAEVVIGALRVNVFSCSDENNGCRKDQNIRAAATYSCDKLVGAIGWVKTCTLFPWECCKTCQDV